MVLLFSLIFISKKTGAKGKKNCSISPKKVVLYTRIMLYQNAMSDRVQ